MASDAKKPKICYGCKSEQLKKGKEPRALIRLPIEIMHDDLFLNKGMPLFLCEHCDELELKQALEAHKKRTGNK